MALSKSILLAFCLTTLVTWGHRGEVSKTVRRVTYPSDFSYVSKGQISPPMLQMGRESRALNQLLRERNAATDQEVLRRQAIQHLTAIDAAARELDNQTGWQSNHPGLKGNLARLRSDIRNARREIEKDPPSYFLAGSITGACLYCHGGG